MMKSTLYIFCLLILGGCRDNLENKDIYSKYKPILIKNSKIYECVWESEKPNNQITLTRKMGNFILTLDYGLGIHIIDAAKINEPQKIGFYRIPACVDFEVKDQQVYANNYHDFIVIDFAKINSPVIIKRNLNQFSIDIKTPDGLEIFESLKKTPIESTIISYEKIN
jgi:hypothetical protein